MDRFKPGRGARWVQEGCPVKDQRLCSFSFIPVLSNYFRMKNGLWVQCGDRDVIPLGWPVSLSWLDPCKSNITINNLGSISTPRSSQISFLMLTLSHPSLTLALPPSSHSISPPNFLTPPTQGTLLCPLIRLWSYHSLHYFSLTLSLSLFLSLHSLKLLIFTFNSPLRIPPLRHSTSSVTNYKALLSITVVFYLLII